MIKFYDTNYLLELNDNLFSDLKEGEMIFTSSICLEEIEHIKESRNKSEEIKYKARRVARQISENFGKLVVIVYDDMVAKIIKEHGISEPNNDVKICGCAAFINNDEIVFYTNDINCRIIANTIFELQTKNELSEKENIYTGFKEVVMSDEDMAYFYEHQYENNYDLLINQYLIIRNNNNDVVDMLRWDGNTYNAVSFPKIKTNYFGETKPYNKDIYQQLVLNSLDKNQLTMIKGAAGTGKSYLALGYLFWLLEKHKIDKIVMFVNPTPTANAAKLGFLPGSQLEKLVDSSVGNMLAGKLGDKVIIDQLVIQNKLTILPMCDIRGYDTTGQNCAVYITEAQNMDVSLMKLALQRIGEDTKVIIDGDYNAQVDLIQYSGDNNGMKRMSEVFRGQDFYGEIELKNIYRSRIALIAEEM